MVRGDKGPVAISSKLGYILSGNIETPNRSDFICTQSMFIESSLKNSPSNTVKSVFGDVDRSLTNEELNVYNRFKETVRFNNGRYEVELPFKDNLDLLGDNYNVAKCRLKSLYEGQFKRNKALYIEYNEVFKDQLKHK